MCIGPFKRACHWGPLIALGIIKAVTMTTVSCLSQWWPPWVTIGGTIFFITFIISAVLTLYFFMQAMFTGPGSVTLGWKPEIEADCQFLQFCTVCQGYKPPRAHHCRKCGSCNMKMDHHCPWINNCVGHMNHGSFTLFLFFAVVGCAQGTVILGSTIYTFIYRSSYIYSGRSFPPISMTLFGLVSNMFVLGLAIGVVIAVGMLLYFQLRGILRNRTGIEDWILEKALYRRRKSEKPFIYPYDLGRWNNFTQVINCKGKLAGDGYYWPVRDDCNQYTLTVEQIAQKAEKRARSREYIIIESFSGYWFPCTKGFGTCCHPPCTDEPRIKLEVGDTVIVTRWKKYWLYGEKVMEESELSSGQSKPKNRHRGWFPRRCAVEVIPPSADDISYPLDQPSSHHSSFSNSQSFSYSNSQSFKSNRHKKTESLSSKDSEGKEKKKTR
ncbi:UNVERIFIED_CONTAM: hypothetical protein RMT77_009045 [Armadillidium vulgare]